MVSIVSRALQKRTRAHLTTSRALADAHPRKGEASIGEAFSSALLDVPGFLLERISEPLRGFEIRSRAHLTTSRALADAHPLAGKASAMILLAGLGFACSHSPAPPAREAPSDNPPHEPTNETTPSEPSPPPPLPWEEKTFSPRPASPEKPELEELVRVCGAGDQSLHEVAKWVAERQIEEGQTPGLDHVRFHLHRRGAPYVMPRLWSAQVVGVSFARLREDVQEWAQTHTPFGSFRCGAASAQAPDGSQIVSVIQVDVLAEMMPLPTRTQAGSFLDLETKLLAGSTAANVVLLPPKGRPFSVTPDLDGQLVHARLSLPTEGMWLVQVMATQQGGPRPVAEALVSAGTERPSRLAEQPVPGEKAFDPRLSREDALFALMNQARQEEGLPKLTRNEKLDAVAQKHSDAMLERGRVSHNTGSGNPARRTEQAGFKVAAVGENVALAASVPRLHRVLWASPSHRENLLLRRWEEVGVAISEREDGTLFATQLFIDR